MSMQHDLDGAWRGEFRQFASLQDGSLIRRRLLKPMLRAARRALSQWQRESPPFAALPSDHDCPPDEVVYRLNSRLALDFEDRDRLRDFHLLLATVQRDFGTLPQIDGAMHDRFHRVLCSLSSRAISASRWVRGLAYVAVHRSRRRWPLDHKLNWATEVVTQIVRRVRLGKTCYDPRKETKIGGFFSTFLFCAAARARNNAGTAPPRRERLVDLEQIPDDEPDFPATQIALLKDALAELEPSSRELLHLYFFEGMSIDEIAKALNGSKATIGRRLQQIRRKLGWVVGRN